MPQQQHPPSSARSDEGVRGDDEREPLPTVRLDISWAAFTHVVHWLYADELLPGPAMASAGAADGDRSNDNATEAALDVPLAVELLDVATRLMLPGLKNLACAALIAQSDAIDVFSLHELATLYELPR